MKPLVQARLETAAIALGLFSFWPYVFGHRGLAYLVGLVLIMAALAAVAVARVRRIRRAFERVEEATGTNIQEPSDGAGRRNG